MSDYTVATPEEFIAEEQRVMPANAAKLAEDGVSNGFQTTTGFLLALVLCYEERFDDLKGAEMIREFAHKFAAHEAETI